MSSELVYSGNFWHIEKLEFDKKNIIENKIAFIDSASTDSLFDWNRDGLYLWTLRGDSQKIFYIEENMNVTLMQYPFVKYSRWIHPQEFLKELSGEMTHLNAEKCIALMKIEDSLYRELKKYPLEEIPDFQEDVSSNNVENDLFLGFVKSEGVKKYFYFHDIRQSKGTLKRPLDVLMPLFKLLDSYPFNVDLRDCQ